MVRLLVDKGAPVSEAGTSSGITPLHQAIRTGAGKALVELLLEEGDQAAVLDQEAVGSSREKASRRMAGRLARASI